MAAYSFLSIVGAIVGFGGSVNLGNGSAASEEGISFDNIEEKDVMVIGADGAVMHSLRAGNGAKCTARFLKTSPTNAILMQMYNDQRTSVLGWGQNVITVSDIFRGDQEVMTDCAFMKPPANVYSKDGAMMEWEFAGNRNTILGVGTPTLAG